MRVCSQILPGPGQAGEEEAVAAEQLVAYPGQHGDLEPNAVLKHADMAWMHVDLLARCERVAHDLPAEFDPEPALPCDLLQQEAVAAEDARTQASAAAPPTA